MGSWQHLFASNLNKAAVIFGSILIVAGVIFLVNEYRPGQFRRYGTGTVVFNQLEGGFWGIVADDGERYDIHDGFFPEDFHVNGLRVKFEGYVNPDLGCFHMWGEIFTLTAIRKL